MWKVYDVFSILLSNYITVASNVLTTLLELVYVSHPYKTTDHM